jgi:hypothetical protein
MTLPLFLIVFVNVYIHFRIWTRIRIRNPLVTDPDPAKVSDPDPQHWSNVSVSGKNHIQLNKQFCKICPDMQVVIFEIFIKKKIITGTLFARLLLFLSFFRPDDVFNDDEEEGADADDHQPSGKVPPTATSKCVSDPDPHSLKRLDSDLHKANVDQKGLKQGAARYRVQLEIFP